MKFSSAPRLSDPKGGALLRWYNENKRDLPWRKDTNPYRVWVSEIMLQQTQVSTVLDYYERWMRRFPDLNALADADEEDVLGMWQGLGYYRRCRMLHHAAKLVRENGFPQSSAEWKRLPGIGAYTAAAISSITLGEPVAVVDGNVERVFARLTGNRATGTARTQGAQAWADKQLYIEEPGDWNQAMMELGATVCTPKNPDCKACPLQNECVALQSWTVDQLPVPNPRQAIVKLEHRLLIPFHGGKLGLLQIESGDWWEGMWGFPRSTSKDDPELAKGGWIEEMGSLIHTVTNHRIDLSYAIIHLEDTITSLRWVNFEEIRDVPLPAPQRKALRTVMKLKGWSQ